MAIRKIITLPNRHLREKSKPLNLPIVPGQWDKKTKEIINDLLDTVKSTKDPEGVGLSAVQIDKLVRIFVVKLDSDFEIIINPVITNFSKRMLSGSPDKKLKQIMEGCLSIPLLYGYVDRPLKIKMSWVNIHGNKKTATFEGKEAIYLQHEYDHINGILFIDHVLRQNQKLYQLEKNEKGKEELVEVEIG